MDKVDTKPRKSGNQRTKEDKERQREKERNGLLGTFKGRVNGKGIREEGIKREDSKVK